MFATGVSRAILALNFIVSTLLLAALPFPAWSQAPAQGAKSPAVAATGMVNSLSGAVFIRRGAGGLVPARPGDLIESGTTVSTAAGGEAVLLFPDGQHVSLSADSALRVDEYHYDARDVKASRVSFALTAGIMRIVAGAMNAANPDALRISAGDALIGVRSKDATSFVVEAETKIARETGSVAVIVGQVSIQRPNGTAITVAADQFTRWQPALSPEQAQPLGSAPARLQAMASIGGTPLAREGGPTLRTGIVNSVSGNVLIRNASGGESAAKSGNLIERGTIVSTGPGGEAVLLFPDGQHVTLNSDSVLRVVEYQFDPADIKASRISFGLITGMMRIVTGAINAANPDAMKISAGDALIGVRSKDATSFVVEADTKFAREAGSVAVIVGEISVQLPNGTAVKVEADQFTRWQPSVSPQQPLPVSAAPAQLQAMAAAGEAPSARESSQSVARSGVVNSVSGAVQMRTGAVGSAPAKIGDVVDVGSIVSTGTNGEAVLMFPDGQHVSLSPDSVLRVDEYRYDTRDSKESRASFTLSTGTMQIVTGGMHATNPDALRISAGDAVIGVLSKEATSFVVEADTKVSREAGSLAVIAGEVSVRRPDGTSTKVESEQYTRWQPKVALEEPTALAAAPADLKSVFVASQPSGQDVPLDVETAVKLALATLPPTASGPEQPAQAQQVPAQSQPDPGVAAAGILPPVTPGGAGGCSSGSPC